MYVDYKLVKTKILPCYRYIEDNDSEKYFIDKYNCELYTLLQIDKETRLFKGKNWWLMLPYIPLSIRVSPYNKTYVKWFVKDSSISSDINCLWDFNTHKVNKNIKVRF